MVVGSLPSHKDRAAGVPYNPQRIGAEQVILHGGPMRSDDDEISPGFLCDAQNFGVDALALGRRPADGDRKPCWDGGGRSVRRVDIR